MIIDSHAHLKHGDAGRTECPPEEIIAAMDGAGIAKSVVFAMSTTTLRSIEMAAEAVERYPERLIPYVYALPHYERPVLAEIEDALSSLGFRGIKLHVGECTLAEYVAGPVFELAAEYGAPCLIDFAGRLELCQEAVEAHPQTKFIVAHLGRYLSQDEALIDSFIRLAEEHENVWLDVSGVSLAYKIAEAARRVGAARIIFGTDGPHSLQPERAKGVVDYARGEVAKIESLDLTETEKAAILGGSVATLLRLGVT